MTPTDGVYKKFPSRIEFCSRFRFRLCAAAVSLGHIGRWSGREIARSALSLARLAQAERDNESCFFSSLVPYIISSNASLLLLFLHFSSKEATHIPPRNRNSIDLTLFRYFFCLIQFSLSHIGKTRDTRSGSSEPTIRKEPFTHLSEKELIEEANKVIAQADSVTCTADHPPEKFFSLPYRRKFKAETSPGRRNSDEFSTEEGKSTKSSLGRSTSDVNPKKNTKERTSLSTLFRRAQRNKSPETPVVVATKPIPTVKRSKSDVSDQKSNTKLTNQPKPIRKRSGSETEEFLKSLRNKKTQLSPIIESSPREDYFKKTPPLETYQKQKLVKRDSNKSEDNSSQQNLDVESKKVNPIEKPPRHKVVETQVSEPKPPTRNKRGKSAEKEKKDQSPPITVTPKKKTDVKKTLLDERQKVKDTQHTGSKEMIHSSQQPPDKPPLTRGHTVDHIVRILKEDQQTTPPKAHLISPPNNGTNNNQPFSYTKPSISPDPNLYIRSSSPDRPTSPVNKMNTNKGIVYAQVVKADQNEYRTNNFGKHTIRKTYSPANDKIGNFSDEDEGLGYEDHKNKFSVNIKYDDEYKSNSNINTSQNFKIIDSPIRPRFREYKLKSFEDFEPTYANEYPSKDDRSQDFVDGPIRGRADGMDSKRKNYAEVEIAKGDIDFNELTHRRQLLESRLKARRYDRNRINSAEPISRYLAETDPIYEAEKRMKATEKYVNDTARYYRNTLEREEFAESSIAEDYNKSELLSNKVKYNTETRTFERIPKDELNRREFIDNLRNGSISRFRDDEKVFPPEPEYEPPSLDSHAGKPVLYPDEYTEKKYKTKSRHFTSSHDMLQSSQKYSKNKDDWFGKRKGHYASNPEIAQEREDYYANVKSDSRHQESYHNSLRRNRDYKDKYYGHDSIRRHDSGDSRDYAYRDDRSPRRFDIDSRLVDSGIENDFRKDSNGEIHRTNPRYRIHESDEDVRNTSMLLASERRHTEENYPSEQIYANGEYIARFEDFRPDEYSSKTYIPRDHSADDGSQFDSKVERIESSPTNRHNEKVSSKPPKAVKKLSGLEKMKQLFSRDSSKKSKKEKETVQSTKTRTRVLKSPEHLARDDPEYRRYRDPEPSDDDLRRKEYDLKNSDPESNYRRDHDRRYTEYKENDISKKQKDRNLRDSDPERYRETERQERRRYERNLNEVSKYKEERKEGPAKRYKEYAGSSEDRDSDHRSPKPSDIENELKTSRETSRITKSKTADPMDSPTLRSTVSQKISSVADSLRRSE
ncbi:hypothetical protein EVAR_42710_1 [Eumeta japonica]|uniref:Uncharacterized protein n=1 Tax=Eumeta variegata TaxID=151549 RepID=A0A4C1WY83_EUMVA|nr:hypothetical protein EVAR_42710_1 [Eumeta japonica]